MSIAKQTTMDRFFNVKKKTKTIFYIDWQCSQPCAQWLIDYPQSNEIHFSCEVKWKDVGYPITICCSNSVDHTPPNLVSESEINNIPLLKSHLQKCTRRQLTDKALATANILAGLDFQIFIRRLSIIMFEDVHLHLSFSSIVWLISAMSKGYQINRHQYEWIMGIVKYLCNCKFYDKIDKYLVDHNSISFSDFFKSIEKQSITDVQKNMLYSILFRTSYGGLKGDMLMLNAFANIWMKRFVNKQTFLVDDIIIYKNDTTKHSCLNICDIELCSADFHCYPKITNIIHKKFPQYTLSDIRECIWECGSKINYRENYQELTDDKWLLTYEDIKDYLYIMQKYLIENNILINRN